MTTLNLEGSSSFIFEVVANGLVVVVDEDMDGHWTGAAKNVAAGQQKMRKEKREKHYHLCIHIVKLWKQLYSTNTVQLQV